MLRFFLKKFHKTNSMSKKYLGALRQFAGGRYQSQNKNAEKGVGIAFPFVTFNSYPLLFALLYGVLNFQVLPITAADATTLAASQLQFEGFTKAAADTNDLSKNPRKLFVTNVFPSSFIFYTDESSANLMKYEEILQKHCIFKMPRSVNATKAQVRRGAKQQNHHKPSVVTATADEDYFLEYDENFTHESKFAQGTACTSCQQHEKVKNDSLESIKKHILMRLQLTHPPNITMPPPVVPQKILDYFYKNFNYSRAISTPVYKHQFNSRSHKRKTKGSSTNIDGVEVLTEEEHEDAEPDIMFNDNAYNSFDEDFANPSMQSDEFYSRLHSIYVFPTKSRRPYNRKPEIFNFKYNSDPTRISSTILHVYIKGQNWFYEYQRDLAEKQNMEASIKNKEEIMIIVYRALRRPNTMNYTHTVKLVESRQKIPPGKGHWVEIEIKELSNYWMKTPNSTQSIVIRGMESWMRTFIVTEDQNTDKSLTMHIEIVTKVKNRYKRNAALDCRESDNEVRCCRYPLKVNFTNFGWNFIVAPQHFDAYFCNGECNVGYLEKYTHTHITSLSTSAKPCCSPQKLSPLALLYFDNNNKLMYSTIPNMSVEKCSCS